MQKLMPGTGPYEIKAGPRISQSTAVLFLLYRAYAQRARHRREAPTYS